MEKLPILLTVTGSPSFSRRVLSATAVSNTDTKWLSLKFPAMLFKLILTVDRGKSLLLPLFVFSGKGQISTHETHRTTSDAICDGVKLIV